MGDADERTIPVVLTDDPGNTSRARVDGKTLLKGDVANPTDLNEDQIKRLETAGVKLSYEGSDSGDSGDSIDRIRTHAEADSALAAASVTVADGTDLDGKKDALREAAEQD